MITDSAAPAAFPERRRPCRQLSLSPSTSVVRCRATTPCWSSAPTASAATETSRRSPARLASAPSNARSVHRAPRSSSAAAAPIAGASSSCGHVGPPPRSHDTLPPPNGCFSRRALASRLRRERCSLDSCTSRISTNGPTVEFHATAGTQQPVVKRRTGPRQPRRAATTRRVVGEHLPSRGLRPLVRRRGASSLARASLRGPVRGRHHDRVRSRDRCEPRDGGAGQALGSLWSVPAPTKDP